MAPWAVRAVITAWIEDISPSTWNKTTASAIKVRLLLFFFNPRSAPVLTAVATAAGGFVFVSTIILPPTLFRGTGHPHPLKRVGIRKYVFAFTF